MLDTFLEFETKNKLFNKEIQNVKFWHIIRYSLYREIVLRNLDIGHAHNADYAKGSKKHILAKVRQLKYVLKSNVFKNIKENKVLIFNHPRRVLDSDLYKCLYTSNLASEIYEDYLMIENPHNLKHYNPILEKKIVYSDIISFIFNFKKMKNKLIHKRQLNEQDEVYIIDLIDKINKEFDVNFNYNKFISKLEERLLLYKVNYSFYKKILERVKPKIIIQVVSYANTLYEVNQVASELGIPTIELQHGTMGKYHIAYNFANKIEIGTFPDYVFTFGDYWKENTRLPIDSSKIISVGWPYYEDKVIKQEKIDSDKTTILFISQGPIGKKLSKIAKQVEENIDLSSYQIIYKLHPGEYDIWKVNYPWLINSNVEVVDHNNYDMHYYFNQADIQIGVNSTAIFEGLGYNLKTFIVKLYGHEYMEDLYKNGHVKLVEHAKELLHFLNEDSVTVQEFDTSYFWETNSMEKMLAEINKIAGTNFKP